MDSRTIDYYDRKATEGAERYAAARGGISDLFEDAFPANGSRILDVGAAAGRDMKRLTDLGLSAWVLESAATLRDEAIPRSRNLNGKILPLVIPLPEGEQLKVRYDGIVCSAVLMHVSEKEVFDAACRSSAFDVTKPGGRMTMVLPWNQLCAVF